jgi:hypothetical protein
MMARLKKWNWWAWALFAGTFFVVAGVALNEFFNWWHPTAALIGEWASSLAHREIGWVLLGLVLLWFVFFSVLIIVAWVETSPLCRAITSRLKPKPTPAPPLGQDEKDSIHQVRKMWENFGKDAASKLGGLYDLVALEDPPREFY